MENRRISIGPKDVLRLKKPTNGFLCPLDNEHNIDFLSFTIKDDTTKRVLFKVENGLPLDGHLEIDYDQAYDEDSFRAIKYTFSEDVLRLPVLSTSLTFKVGEKPLSNFRMIERHYVKNQLIKSYDFNFGFCIPNSTNTWEAIYDVPPLSDEIIEEMVDKPYSTTSDSFYFVGDELIMHNKAKYRYVKSTKEEYSADAELERLSLVAPDDADV